MHLIFFGELPFMSMIVRRAIKTTATTTTKINRTPLPLQVSVFNIDIRNCIYDFIAVFSCELQEGNGNGEEAHVSIS